jgi:hypothetical protein
VEVGTTGQARLSASTVALRSVTPLGREVERRYLQGADVRVLGEGEGGAGVPHQASDAVSPWGELHGGAREVAEGALRALSAVRAALFMATREGA